VRDDPRSVQPKNAKDMQMWTEYEPLCAQMED
jgi:hypothetical protein